MLKFEKKENEEFEVKGLCKIYGTSVQYINNLKPSEEITQQIHDFIWRERNENVQ